MLPGAVSTKEQAIPLLNEENYEDWSAKVMNYLRFHDIWDVVKDPKPEQMTANWSKQDSKAMGALFMCIRSDILTHVRQCESASEIWVKLKRRNTRKTLGAEIYLRRQLYGARFEKGNMAAHLTYMSNLID